jgi:hypothetical protein
VLWYYEQQRIGRGDFRLNWTTPGVRLRQVETKHMQLHAHAADNADAFAEIDLRVAGRMDERDEDLARFGAGDPHVTMKRKRFTEEQMDASKNLANSLPF